MENCTNVISTFSDNWWAKEKEYEVYNLPTGERFSCVRRNVKKGGWQLK
jgi:hypothetical protein